MFRSITWTIWCIGDDRESYVNTAYRTPSKIDTRPANDMLGKRYSGRTICGLTICGVKQPPVALRHHD